MFPLLLLLELFQKGKCAANHRDGTDRMCGFGSRHGDTTFGGIGDGAVEGQGRVLKVDVLPLKSQTFTPPKPRCDKHLKNTAELKITGEQGIEETDGFIFRQGIHIPL